MKIVRTSRKYLIPLVILLLGLAGIALGVAQGEVYTVLKKATMICLECIGLG